MHLVTLRSRMNHFAYSFPELKSYDLWMNKYSFSFLLLELDLTESIKEPNYNIWENETSAMDSVELTLLCRIILAATPHPQF